uniref:Acetylcholinesterase-like n=1 Tax=Saccoglossus kowalevskii TaxID=10224 RepID=A0ABM0MZ36_SACKO|nr:PREDICTED: acetylcholinesterase-like [Saccoglossus kowalevskii]
MLACIQSTVVLLLFLVVFTHEDDTGPIIQTLYGKVRGKRVDILDTYVDAFLAIPYADPPVGERRFTLPEPTVRQWEGVRNATEYSSSCWQKPDRALGDFVGTDMWNTEGPQSEDCLYLNIWTPQHPRHKTPLPVLVWIHGGSFVTGSGSLAVYNGTTLAAVEQVIVVTLNYRLNTFGFLALENTDSPGNMGLMDQVMALQWIHDNIQFFNGNHDQVTLFGASAGAASVGYHILSPSSRRLFKRAILQSGSPMMPFLSPGTYTEHRHLAKCMAFSLGCLTKEELSYEFNVSVVLKCLRNLPPDKLANSYNLIHFPVQDDRFILSQPADSLNNMELKRTQVLLGANENEGMFNLIRLIPDFSLDTDSHITYEKYLETIGFRFGELPSEVLDQIGEEYVRQHDKEDGESLRDLADNTWGDYDIICPTVEFANEYHALVNEDVFLYNFQHRSSHNPWPEWAGTVHADEIAYVFGVPLHNDQLYSEDDITMSRLIMRFWANFARTGDPNEEGEVNRRWPKYDDILKRYLVLEMNSQNILNTESGLRAKHCEFWKDLSPIMKALTEKAVSTNTPCFYTSASSSVGVHFKLVLLTLLAVSLHGRRL